jgi:hypothetical protein
MNGVIRRVWLVVGFHRIQLIVNTLTSAAENTMSGFQNLGNLVIYIICCSVCDEAADDLLSGVGC